MDNWRKWKKPLKLHEIEEIQNLSDETEIPDGIVLFPPDGWNTDEDSGDENTVSLDNLPGSQLMADAELIFDRQSPDGRECEGDKNRDDIPSTSVKRLKMTEDADSLSNPTGVFEDNHYDSEDELPLATYLPTNQQQALPNKKRKTPLYSWKKEDIKPDFSDWKEYYTTKIRNGGNMDHMVFRRCLAAALLETFKKTTKRGPSKKSKPSESRYDRLDHLVIYQEKQTRCAVCHKQAAFRFEKCDVALHPKTCFRSYHTKQ
ncbi:piggyBac transposable element-derived protein 3-like [Sitophilus oryzae]|uniref:PiggyBac transposable element-derived protein 3-like n=1 Tax=Sitophilus oryzae TaxID=7048 RepID=A0A6J2YG31_SITOR|nr:piggyBac transposable element-derived protein 3-like [Sitophilus oryzae]